MLSFFSKKSVVITITFLMTSALNNVSQAANKIVNQAVSISGIIIGSSGNIEKSDDLDFGNIIIPLHGTGSVTYAMDPETGSIEVSYSHDNNSGGAYAHGNHVPGAYRIDSANRGLSLSIGSPEVIGLPEGSTISYKAQYAKGKSFPLDKKAINFNAGNRNLVIKVGAVINIPIGSPVISDNITGSSTLNVGYQ